MMQSCLHVNLIVAFVALHIVSAQKVEDSKVVEGDSKVEDMVGTKYLHDVPIYNYDKGSFSAYSNKKTEWLLVLKAESTDNDLNSICDEAEAGCDAKGHPSEGGIAFADVRATEAELGEILKKHPGEIDFIEPSMPIFLPPGEDADNGQDNALVDLVGAHSAGSTDRWGLDRIDDRKGLDGTYVPPRDGRGIHVYILDTGVRTTHEDFGGRAIPTLEAFSGTNKVCQASDTTCANDAHGHGTHCSGTVGGIKSGVAKGATLHAVKVLSDSGRGSTAGIVNAIDWVMQNAPKPAVISMSLGGAGRSIAFKTAIDKAAAARLVSIVAGGNDNKDSCNYSPAFVPSAITVGATNKNDARASFSNYGTCTDIFAPGRDINSAWRTNDGSYKSISGTSMACPHVAGAAALLLQDDPNLSAADISKKLRDTSTKDAISNVGGGSPNMLLYLPPDSVLTTTTTPQPLTPAAGFCGFESSTTPYCGIWHQNGQDNFDWTQHSGSTPTASTGPSQAHGGSHYIYTEVSSPIKQNDEAILEALTPTLQPGSFLSFFYHMKGTTNMGALKVVVRVMPSGEAQEVWSKSGNQGDQWAFATIPLVMFSGKSVTIAFIGSKGNTYYGDIAVDDVSLSIGQVATTTPVSTSSTTVPTTTTTTSNPFGKHGWFVSKGSCSIDASGCALSPNYPSYYSPKESCSIVVRETNSGPIKVDAFNTEAKYDFVVVNGIRYSGNQGPDGVVANDVISWSSDYSVERSGWKICIDSKRPTSTTGMPISSTPTITTTTTITTFSTTAPPLHVPVCNGDASTNIVGGTDAPRCGHPWMVSLQTSSNFHFCGGSLIDATHVLSAAHCCANMGNGAGYKAVIGDWKIETNNIMDRCPGEQTRTFSAVDMHPSYNPTSTSNDFCVITLAAPVVAGTLAPQLASARPTDGTCTSVIGWGTTAAGGSSPDILQTVDVPIVSDAECASSYSGYEPGNMLCAGYSAGGHDSCQGDSGGPHFTVVDGMATLVGVVSWGAGCASAGYPGVYAKVDSALDWIATFVTTISTTTITTIATTTTSTTKPTPTTTSTTVTTISTTTSTTTIATTTPTTIATTKAASTTTSSTTTPTTTAAITSSARPDLTATTTSNPSGKHGWFVSRGSCSIDANGCASSPNYPRYYSPKESCSIVVEETGSGPITVESFSTERNYDYLVVNGVRYSGNKGPDGVVPKGLVAWSSDYSVERSGWKICMGPTWTTSTPEVPTTSTSVSITTATPITTTTITTTTTAMATRQPTTSLTTTMAMPSTTLNIEGLTPGEAALYNPALASYWDLHHCAKASDNHNWSWCWSRTGYECQQEVQVEQTLCASGKASIGFSHRLSKIDGCIFSYYTQYVCQAPGGSFPSGPGLRRLTDIILV